MVGKLLCNLVHYSLVQFTEVQSNAVHYCTIAAVQCSTCSAAIRVCRDKGGTMADNAQDAAGVMNRGLWLSRSHCTIHYIIYTTQ